MPRAWPQPWPLTTTAAGAALVAGAAVDPVVVVVVVVVPPPRAPGCASSTAEAPPQQTSASAATAGRARRSTWITVADACYERFWARGSGYRHKRPPPAVLIPLPATTRILPPRYVNVEPLGAGGMGEIYRAVDEELGRPVVVKVLAERYARDDALRQRFKREALAAARLSSAPNIVTIFDVGEHDSRPYIVMELLGGGSLAARAGGRAGPAAPALASPADGALQPAVQPRSVLEPPGRAPPEGHARARAACAAWST